MEIDDVQRACDAILGRIIAVYGDVRPIERGRAHEHVFYMIQQIPEFMEQGRREKAMRWFGFVQGYAWQARLATIDQMKNDNRPRIAYPDAASGAVGERHGARTPRWYWWKFVHNLLVHPFLALPWEPRWAQRAHDWTADRCKGGG